MIWQEQVPHSNLASVPVGSPCRLAGAACVSMGSSFRRKWSLSNVAAHLEPGGCFVIEVIVPQLRRLPPGETIRAFTTTPTHLGFEEFDVANQIAFSHHYWVVDGQLETFSAPFRYVWPAELDLMARLAGMTLRDRWSNWNRKPFTSDSREHISVWEKAG